ncbi:hypothetical protein EK21DRAFT_75127 [Setomelanomma holmii]|uniref:Uncharacterized protein n=1 Tax=Setomelanomma holmii TaxID=210430 RepID=A0A9P4LIV8_9PLEO|nr:hypothetical protein EK21DRAFT_75127 [Setomelanomma holmii]
MAPIVAGTAAPSAQRQARRPLPRIVPAIPHRLSRTIPSARPITPDESNQGAVAHNEPQPQPQPRRVVEKLEEESQPTTAVDAPMTPDSRASVDKSEVGAAVLAASPAKSAEDHIERAVHDAGVEPEPETNGHAMPDPDTQLQPVTNGAHRKLTVPTELPPPFYPSSKTDRQTLHTDGSDAAVPQSHRSQLSAGAAAFRARNGSPATPATPYEIEQDSHDQLSAGPRPPPGFAPPEFTPSFFPGHSHHPSEAGAAWPYQPYPDLIHTNGSDFNSPSFPPGPDAYAASFDDPQRPAVGLNGTLTAPSQSPNKAQFGEVKPSSDHGEDQRGVTYPSGSPLHTERFGESPFELAAYLSTQFGNPEFADFILQIRSPDSILVSIPVHGIVVVRSPVIAEAVRRSMPAAHRSRDTRRMLDVLVTDPFVTRESLEEAVKVLYGAPLLSPQPFLYGIASCAYDNNHQSSSNDAQKRMRQLLSYIAAGRALQLPSMQACGVDIARSLLRWDTVGEVLQVALHSSTAARMKNGSEPEDPFTAALLNYAIDFMAYTFPVDFKLYSIAPELQELPRLPVHLDARPAAHNPRLSKIRFGDAPLEDNSKPGHAARMLSSILLSMPLTLLDRLFNHRATANQIGWTGVVKVMRDVVTERENRRQKALKGEVRPVQDGNVPSALLHNVYIEERIEQVEPSSLYPSGHRMTAQRLTSDA